MSLVKYLIAVIALLLFVFLCVLAGFFFYAFVKRSPKNSAVYDLHLGKYKDSISEGIRFLDSTPYTALHTTSFDGLKLSARFYAKDKAKGTIILFHGYRSSAKRDFSCAAEMYYNMGFNLLLVDQRGCGDSEGRLITFGIKERRDVIGWARLISEKCGKDMPIFMSGISMGATSVLMATGLELPENVKGIIADSSFTSPVDIMKEVALKRFHINADAFLPFMDLLCRIFGKFSIYETTTVASVKKSTVSILFIHGESDGFVPCSMTHTAYDAAVCDRYIITVPNADHGLAYLVDKQGVVGAVTEFIDRYI